MQSACKPGLQIGLSPAIFGPFSGYRAKLFTRVTLGPAQRNYIEKGTLPPKSAPQNKIGLKFLLQKVEIFRRQPSPVSIGLSPIGNPVLSSNSCSCFQPRVFNACKVDANGQRKPNFFEIKKYKNEMLCSFARRFIGCVPRNVFKRYEIWSTAIAASDRNCAKFTTYGSCSSSIRPAQTGPARQGGVMQYDTWQ